MRRWLVPLVVLVGARAAQADPPAAPSNPVAPAARPAPLPTSEQAADAVLAAVKAKDDAALKALAAKDDPDPWLVADELIRRGDFDAADGFAKAAPRASTERLSEYIAKQRGSADGSSRRRRLADATAALRSGHAPDALEVLAPMDSNEPSDVAGVLIAARRGQALRATEQFRPSEESYRLGAEGAERLGWLHYAAMGFADAATSARRDGGLRRVVGLLERSRSLWAKLGERTVVGRIDNLIGNIHQDFGEYDEALKHHGQSVAIMHDVGEQEDEATALGNLGNDYGLVGDFGRAQQHLEQALRKHIEMGNRSGEANCLGGLGNVFQMQGDYLRALDHHERWMRLAQADGDRRAEAMAQGNIGNDFSLMGRYASAFRSIESALAMNEALGDLDGVGRSMCALGNLRQDLGEYDAALEYHRKYLGIVRQLGARAGEAMALQNIGNDYSLRGEGSLAVEAHEQARALSEALGDRAAVARSLDGLGNDSRGERDFVKALEFHERAWRVEEQMGVRASQALLNVGTDRLCLADRVGALTAFGRVAREAEETGNDSSLAEALAGSAMTQLDSASPAEALATARRAASVITRVARGLGDEQGAGARTRLTEVFAVGARSAARLKDPAAASFFVESGRAGALLEALKARGALWDSQIPDELRRAEVTARSEETVASRALAFVANSKDLEAIRAKRKALDGARDRVRDVIARVQREAKAAAGILYPESDPLLVIQARLANGDALVSYGLFDEEPLALVVTAKAATFARLPATKDVEDSAAALLAAIDDRAGAEVTNRAADRLRDFVVKPLGLSPDTKRLLISPDGVLSYVPFALLDADHEIVYVPSGTTYGLLLEDGKARGDGVLALGDPDYQTKVDERAAGIYARGAAGRLTRLPATADEAKAVGGTVLLGKDATEKGLREAVATKPRWRAVHFACHGLIDSERPAFSSLALTADGEDDGFLTVLEVFRAKIPADLVVLSACETAKGKVVKGEGIMGLTRAFMFAGSPRVICSLWKVDDDATRALMTKFYELWNPKDGKPGLPAATALKQAQEFVRDDLAHPRWKHPYYWAAWVLWGLPS